jgi:hypothetical protein
VVRNLSALRHEKNRPSPWDDAALPKHREPDQGILEHEKKRRVEIKCLELQVDLEDKGVDEADIEKKVDELRQKLLANLASIPGPQSLKPTDTHGMAAAKKKKLKLHEWPVPLVDVCRRSLLLLEEDVGLIHGHLPFVPSHVPDRDLPLVVGHGVVPTLHLRVVSVPLLTCLLLHVKGACDNGVLIEIVLRSSLLGLHQK